MKKTSALVVSLLLAVSVAVVAVFAETDISFLADEKADTILKNCMGRCLLSLSLVTVALRLGYGKIFTERSERPRRALLWCVPCILVCLANFPYGALASGKAVCDRADLIWAFAFECLFIACTEEVLFRGIIYELLREIFTGKKFWAAVLLESAVFALCHLFNLIGGQSVGETLLQVGYTFLTGIMFTAVSIRTGNIWVSVAMHTVFDFGGLFVSTLGTGSVVDVSFVILTAACGVLCALHVAFYFLKKIKADRAADSEGF